MTLSNVGLRCFLLVSLLGGCFSTGPLEPAQSFDGHVWQVVAEGAMAKFDDSDILILDNNNNPVRGAKCLCPAEHILLLSVQQGVGEGGPVYDFLVGDLRQKAVDNCKYVAYNLIGVDPGSDNCVQAVLNYNDGAPVNTAESCTKWNYECGPLSEIDPEGEDEVWDDDPDAGAETDTESDLTPLDELDLHVSCSMGTCLISRELHQFALDHPEALDFGGATLHEHSPTGELLGFQFVDVPSGCLAAYLGFRAGDVVTAVADTSVASRRNWPAILGTLAKATTVTVRYERGSTEQVLTVTVAE